MPDILQLLQNRVGPLKGKQREVADHFLWTALLQIDMIDQVKDLREGFNKVQSQKARESHISTDRSADQPLTREEVYDELKCKRTTVWELEQLGLLNSFPVIGQGKCFDPVEVQRVKAMDPMEVSLMIKQQKARRNAKEAATRKKASPVQEPS